MLVQFVTFFNLGDVFAYFFYVKTNLSQHSNFKFQNGDWCNCVGLGLQLLSLGSVSRFGFTAE